MPTYDYRCAKCSEDLEVYQTFAEAPLTKHKGCGGKLTKVLSPAGIVLKGSGFYKNDSRDSGSKKRSAKPGDAGSEKSSGDSSSEKSSEKKSSETKTSDSSSSSSSPDASKSSSSSDGKSTPSTAKSA